MWSVPTRCAHLSLGVQGFRWETVTKVCGAHVTDLSSSVSGPPQTTLMQQGLKPPPQITLMAQMTWGGSRLQVYKDTLIGGIFPAQWYSGQG